MLPTFLCGSLWLLGGPEHPFTTPVALALAIFFWSLVVRISLSFWKLPESAMIIGGWPIVWTAAAIGETGLSINTLGNYALLIAIVMFLVTFFEALDLYKSSPQHQRAIIGR